MRDYAKVSPKFWIGPTGKAIRKLGAEAQVLAMYLMTSPHANMLGVYHLPVAYIVADTGMSFEGASKGLLSLSEVGFCAYDDASEVVWVYEMAKYQIGESLKPKDNQVEGVRREYRNLPENQFLSGFFDKYKDAFHLEERRFLQAPSKPLASQEQEQEREQEQEQEQEGSGADLLGGESDSSAGASDPKETALQAACRATWHAYAEAYFDRYGVNPVRNATVNSQVKSFAKRIPHDEAPLIAAWYVDHPKAYYTGKSHDFGSLLKDAESLRTEWATGRVMTQARARQSDRAGGTMAAVQEILAEHGRAA